MDSDSDFSNSDNEIPMYNIDTSRADAFRKAISQWKQQQLDTIIGDKQNTTALNVYLKKTKEMYSNITNFIETNVSSDRIDITLRNALGNPNEYNTNTRINILHTLFRDLIEFPFTYDKVLINSFQNDEAVQTNIIPNNID